MRIPFHGYDTFAFRDWTWHLVFQPLSSFYSHPLEVPADHLPGDLWILAITGRIVRLFNPTVDFYSLDYIYVMAGLATLADATVSLLLYQIGKSLHRARAGVVAALAYWCAPAAIFVGSVWGQLDAVSVALAIGALSLAVSSRFSSAFVVLTLCVLVKPQFGMLALPILVGWWKSSGLELTSWVARVASTAALCLGLLAAISAPFGVSLFGGWGQWSLFDRLQFASDRYPVSVLGAHNFWILFDPLRWPPDDRIPWFLGVSRHSWGIALFVVVVGFTAWLLVNCWQGVITMVLASNLLMLGFFLFMTRMHERYMFPVVALALLFALLDSRYVKYATVVSAVVFVNVWCRFFWPLEGAWEGPAWFLDVTLPPHDLVVQGLAIITIGVFGWLAKNALEV